MGESAAQEQWRRHATASRMYMSRVCRASGGGCAVLLSQKLLGSLLPLLHSNSAQDTTAN